MCRVKEVKFKRRDGSIISQEVPNDLDQSLLDKVVTNDYVVIPVSSSRPLPEQAVSRVSHEGRTAGFLIPGQAILSPFHPKNSNPHFGAYSLIVAIEVCARSFRGDYSLSSSVAEAQSQTELPLIEGDAYLVLWKHVIGPTDIERFYPSLFVNGVFSLRGQRDYSALDLSPGESISISQGKFHDAYASAVFWNLYPYAPYAPLRFFYAYQLIEILIGRDFSTRSEAIREKLNSIAPVSVTVLRELVEEFRDSYKEQPRIRQVLSPTCGSTESAVDRLLTALEEPMEGNSFPDKVYRVRNVLFHEHLRAHNFEQEVMEVSDNLTAYLAREKFV